MSRDSCKQHRKRTNKYGKSLLSFQSNKIIKLSRNHTQSWNPLKLLIIQFDLDRLFVRLKREMCYLVRVIISVCICLDSSERNWTFSNRRRFQHSKHVQIRIRIAYNFPKNTSYNAAMAPLVCRNGIIINGRN